MIKIYRIEDKDGRGPYVNFNVQLDRYGTDRHPAPKEDIPFYQYLSWDEKQKYIFGFKSPHQLIAWFSENEREELIDNKYFLSVFTGDPINFLMGKRQLAFQRKDVTLLTQLLIPKGSCNDARRSISAQIRAG